jgi:hypothetical protein
MLLCGNRVFFRSGTLLALCTDFPASTPRVRVLRGAASGGLSALSMMAKKKPSTVLAKGTAGASQADFAAQKRALENVLQKSVQLKDMVGQNGAAEKKMAKLRETVNGMAQVVSELQHKNDKHCLGMKDTITPLQGKIDELKDKSQTRCGSTLV